MEMTDGVEMELRWRQGVDLWIGTHLVGDTPTKNSDAPPLKTVMTPLYISVGKLGIVGDDPAMEAWHEYPTKLVAINNHNPPQQQNINDAPPWTTKQIYET
jgi:hypothetical protein